MKPLIVIVASLWALNSNASTKILAVAPVEVSNAAGKVSPAARADLEELLRDAAVNELKGTDWSVPVGSRTAAAIKNAGKEGSATMELTTNVRFVDEGFRGTLQVVEAKNGRIVASQGAEAATLKELRAAFATRLHELLVAAALVEEEEKEAIARYRVPIGDDLHVVRGSKTARITLVEFADYECPFSARARKTMDELKEQYGTNIRLVMKQNPLTMHLHAQLAAEAALAAADQGRFWELHNKLFDNREHLERADLERYAAEVGLDMPRFKAALDLGTHKARILEDQALAAKLQATGTPYFFINGRPVRGAVKLEKFKEVIDEEIDEANDLIAAGTLPSELYPAFQKDALETAPKEPPKPAALKAALVELGDAPSRGPKDAKVTIVEWADFQCPYCARAKPVIERLLKEHPADVRHLFRHEPLPFHPNAKPAAIASVAFARQGKFWEFYDRAYDHTTELSPQKYEDWAREVGLNLDTYKADLAAEATQELVSSDATYGSRVGAAGTPTFFVNGRLVAGALPYEDFEKIVQEEIARADALLKAGTSRDKLYAEINALNVKNAPKTTPKENEKADDKPVVIPIGKSPVLGAADAPVTLVVFSDFQCPFCGRAEITLAALHKKYGSKLRVVWKNEPLPFHPNARPAAKAALAAGEQGKFWEMHDALFAHQTELSDALFDKLAVKLGLDLERFQADIASSKLDALIDADVAQAKEVEAKGTPTFFVNGHKVVGAQPQEVFEARIDAALKQP